MIRNQSLARQQGFLESVCEPRPVRALAGAREWARARGQRAAVLATGSVYLIGSARSPAELERTTRIARYIPGVKQVIAYVELRPGTPVAEQPTSPARGGPSATSQLPHGS